MKNRVNLIDADSIIYITSFDKKDAPSIKTLQECKDLVDKLIFNMLNYTKSTHYLLFLTVGKSFRFDIYPQYKGNRKYADKPVHFDAIKEYLITKYKAVYNTSLEADDLVCIYKESVPNSFISSIDKDILNLEGDMFDYKNFKWVSTSKDEADLFFWKSMVIGDTVDNIKGIAGKGEKFAESLRITAELVNISMYTLVLDAYIKNYGEYLGVQEFYKNFMCLKMKTKYDGLVLQDPIEFNKYEEEYNLVD
jgi:hypothetical protein